MVQLLYIEGCFQPIAEVGEITLYAHLLYNNVYSYSNKSAIVHQALHL